MAQRCEIPIPTFVDDIEGAPEAEENHGQPHENRIVVTSKGAQVNAADQSIAGRTINGRTLTQISYALTYPHRKSIATGEHNH